MRLTVQSVFLAGAGFLVALLVASFWFTLSNLAARDEAEHWLVHSKRVLSNLRLAHIALLKAAAAEPTASPQEHARHRAELLDALDRAIALTRDNPTVQSPLFQLARTVRDGAPLAPLESLLDQAERREDSLRRKRLLEAERKNATAHWTIRALLFLQLIFVGTAGAIGLWHLRSSKHAHERIGRERAFAQAIVDTVRDGLVVVDSARCLVAANEASRQLLQVPEGPWLKGQSLAALASTWTRDLEPLLTSALAGRESEECECRLGDSLVLRFFAKPFSTDSRTLALVTIHNVTQLRAAERALSDSNEQLTAFAYSVSHDLRAPLRTLQGFSQILVEDHGPSLPADARAHLARIDEAAGRMDALIRDLLEYSRLHRQDIDIKPVHLHRIIERVVLEHTDEIRSKRAALHIDEPLPSVLGHERILTQIFDNLLTNALKFARSGVAPCIGIRADLAPERARLIVEDNGIGIAQQHHERIFGVFERLHGIEAFPGTGIGLAIVRAGAERMNGRAGVESDGHSGSRFWIELPLADTTSSHQSKGTIHGCHSPC